MKKNLFFLFALICSVSLFTACSDDDNESGVALDKVNGTYEGTSLNLTYSGAPYIGKSIIFNATDAQNATLTMSGAAISLMRSDMGLGLSNPSVIPGEAVTTLKVALKAEGAGFAFEGVDEANGRTINYKGSVQEGKLNLDLNVTMPNNDLLGTWNLQEVDPFYDTTSPFNVVWKSTNKITLPIFDKQDPEFLVKMALNKLTLLNVGNEHKSVADVLSLLLKNVTFQADGNVVAEYSEKQNMTDPKWKTSPLNVAQYAIKEGKLYLYLNADAIMQVVMAPKAKAFNPSSILITLLPKLLEFAPMISQGIPMDYALADGNLAVTLDETVCKKLLNNIVAPLLSNQEFMDFVKAQITNNPNIGPMGSMISPVLDQLKDVVPTTTEIKLGLNFSKPVAE